MAEPTPQNVRKLVDPSLRDLLNLVKKEMALALNCHAIGTVQSFDAATQTATITINYKKMFDQRGVNGVYSKVLRDYPLLIDVPVIVLGGGTWRLTFPISQGDECMVLFNDRDIDNWFKSGQNTAPASTRLHDMCDGVALVGLASLKRSIEDYDETHALLQNIAGGAMVGVAASTVLIGNQTTTLNALLQNLISAVKALSINVASVAPAGGTVSPTSQAALDVIATQIAGLLE